MASRRTMLAGMATAAGMVLAATSSRASKHRGAATHGGTTPAPGVSGSLAGSMAGSMAGGPAESPVGPVDTVARWVYILDADTGSVLLQKAANETMPPSSLTKLMTAYLVFGALAAGTLGLAQTLPVSERAWRMQGSKMFVPLGAKIAVDDLIRGMLIQSGNDACIVLAEGIAGSEAQFVVLMNQKAAQLGLAASSFRNATGWPDPDHRMSASDVAMLALHLIRDFPQFYHFFSEKSYKFNNIDQDNRNLLVDRGLADGLKTGHTEAGGFGLCASSLRRGHRIVAVLNGMASARVRGEEGERLLDWAFATFTPVKIFVKDQPVQKVPVWLGQQVDVAVAAASDLTLSLPLDWRKRARIHADFASPLEAPIRAGQVIGRLVFATAEQPERQVPLIAMQDVPALALPARAIAVLEHKIGGG